MFLVRNVRGAFDHVVKATCGPST